MATTWVPQAEVERVEPEEIAGVEFGMEALADVDDVATLRTKLAPITQQYAEWIEGQRAARSEEAPAGRCRGRRCSAARSWRLTGSMPG